MNTNVRASATRPWEEALGARIEAARSRLLSRAEFAVALREVLAHPLSPVAAVQLEIIRPAPHDNLVIGDPGVGPETASFPVDNFGAKAECRIRTWSKAAGARGPTVDFPSVTALLSDWARAFWKADARDVTGLLWWQNAEIRDPLNAALREWSSQHRLVSTFYADLDKFKAANDLFGQAKGDDVIQSFGALLERTIPEYGLVVRQGGDEFLVFVPTSSSTETLRLARNISNGVATYDFGTGDIRIGVAVGVSIGTRFEPDFSAETLAHKAEKGVKPGDAPKLRGLVRFSERHGTNAPSQFTNESRDLAAARVKASLLSAEGLGNPWLDLIAAEAQEVIGDDLSRGSEMRTALAQLIDWAKPEWVLGMTRLGSVEQADVDHTTTISRWDAVLAAAHGVYRAMLRVPAAAVADKRLEVRHSADLSACELVSKPDGEVYFSVGAFDQFDDTFDLGGFFSLPTELEDAPGRRPILVHIGYEEPRALPRSLFDRLILVDARPSASGGLPDFWASAVASVITGVDANPNVPAIYVLGDLQHGVETLNKLTALHNGDVDPDQIADKTGLSLRTIRAALPRLKARVVTAPSTDALYEHLVACLRDPYLFKRPDVADPGNRRTLERPLHMNGLGLTREDGCRVDTINKAFPIVLEIARTSQDDPIRDQASRDVRELVDFKVHFTNPTRDQIPDFYRDDSESFENYFSKQFLAQDGLFGQWFEHQNQRAIVLQHVADVILAGNQFATRRAVLVIPHQTEDKVSPSPLGLISVRIVPRFRGETVNLTYSYTWRTVEALVGFPYSSYGSVRFSQHLTEQIRSLLPEERRANVKIKDVSYVAHSLHFFVDDYGQNIARKIVNDATT